MREIVTITAEHVIQTGDDICPQQVFGSIGLGSGMLYLPPIEYTIKPGDTITLYGGARNQPAKQFSINSGPRIPFRVN